MKFIPPSPPSEFKISADGIKLMKTYIKRGLSFGLTSGVITVLGLMSGLISGTQSRLAVIGGIITIALADSFSDALGMHTSEESAGQKEDKVWIVTFITLLSKFIISISFLIPVLIFELNLALIIASLWGIIIISVLGVFIAKAQKIKPWRVVAEHLFIAIFVLLAANYLGQWVNNFFN